MRSSIDFIDSHRNHPGRALVAKARKYLSNHLDEKVGLTEIAVAIGVSPAYLAQTFRVVEGVSLYRYALRLRLMRALELLPQYDDLSVSRSMPASQITATSRPRFVSHSVMRRRVFVHRCEFVWETRIEAFVVPFPDRSERSLRILRS